MIHFIIAATEGDASNKLEFHIGEALLIAGLIFAVLGLVAGFFIWRNAKARAEKIDQENLSIRKEFEAFRGELEELKNELKNS